MAYGSQFFPIWEQWYDFAQQNYVGPNADGAPEWVVFYRDPIVGFDHRPNIAVSWLWWAFWLLPLDLERARSFHEVIKKHFLVRATDGSAFAQPVPGAGVEDVALTLRALTIAYQVGDLDTAAALRARVEVNYEPTWDRQAGEFHYGFRLGEPIPRGQYNSHIMLSEVGGPGGWWRLFNEPTARRFEEPTVCGVEYPRVGLSEAYYDEGRRTLFLRPYAATPAAVGGMTRFRVTNLKRPGSCRVLADGRPHDRFRVHGDELEIEAPIDERRYQVIEEAT
jgi:hypothetical protein